MTSPDLGFDARRATGSMRLSEAPSSVNFLTTKAALLSSKPIEKFLGWVVVVEGSVVVAGWFGLVFTGSDVSRANKRVERMSASRSYAWACDKRMGCCDMLCFQR